MNIKYDEEADSMYIRIREGEVCKTKKIDDTTIADYDSEGRILGMELLFVKENSILEDFKVENIALTT